MKAWRVCLFSIINRQERNAFRVLLFEVVGEVSIKNIGEDALGFFPVVGLELEPFDKYSVFEEENLDRVQGLELLHSIAIGDHSLLLSDEVELFDSSR